MHDTRKLDALAAALIDLMGCLSSPRQDDVLLREAGVSLDRALFPLLVRLSAYPSMGVAELAEQVGRDPSTVSRQIGKLESLGLVKRKAAQNDMRVREATITRAGTRTVDAITAARRRLLDRLLNDWTKADRDNLPRLIQKLVNAMREGSENEP